MGGSEISGLSYELFDNLLEGCQIIDFNWRYIYLNKAAELHNRKHNNELLGNIYMEMWPGIENTEVFRVLKQCLENRIPEKIENEFVFDDGSTKWFLLSIQPLPSGVLIMSIDITENKLSEKTLIDSEKKFKSVFESSNIAKSITLISGEINVNKAFCDMLGYSEEELRNIKWDAITPEEEIEPTRKQLESLLSGSKSSLRFPKRYIHKNGTYIWTEVSIALSYDTEGKPLFFITTVVDITKLKKAEEARKESEILYHALVDQASEALFAHDFDGKIFEVNQRACDSLGYTRAELLQMSVTDLEQDFDLKSAQAEWSKIEPGKPFSLYGQHKRKDGTIFPVEIRFGCFVWNNQKLFMGLVRDISELKQAERMLRESEERYRNLLDASPVSIAVHSEGRIVFINKAGVKMIGAEKMEQLIGKPITEIIHPSGLQETKERIAKMVAGEKGIYPARDVYLRLDGTTVDVEVMASFLTFNGKPAVQIVISDITERVRVEREIKKLHDELELRVKNRTAQLEDANRELETFTYSVSHDLKAPLRGIDGYSKLLLDLYKENLDEEAKTFLASIRSSTLKMNQTIDDLLEYSRLERSKMSVERIRIKELVESITSSCIENIEAEKFRIIKNIDDVEILADLKGLRIALRNLIENAVKFSGVKNDPVINIGFEEKPSAWLLSVNDNGVGFEMKYNQKIFEIFQRLHRAEDFPGTGIGLAMVSKAMQKMNGKTWAESIPGSGSTFYLEIPKRTEYAI